MYCAPFIFVSLILALRNSKPYSKAQDVVFSRSIPSWVLPPRFELDVPPLWFHYTHILSCVRAFHTVDYFSNIPLLKFDFLKAGDKYKGKSKRDFRVREF